MGFAGGDVMGRQPGVARSGALPGFASKLEAASARAPSARNQCASSVWSAASFHGLIFASAFASTVFATSVS